VTKLGLISRQRKVCDPRDRVFGIQRLLNRTAQIFPSPNYSKSVSTVFTEATKAVISHTSSPNILRHLVWPSQWCGLPSWAISWFTEFQHSSKYYKYSAANGTKAINQFSNNDMELLVKGTFISTVGAVANQIPPSQGPIPKLYNHKCLSVWQQWQKLSSSLTSYYNKEGFKDDFFANNLLGQERAGHV
jgi:hypothetical protein